jgi:hypothetical protein
LAVTATFDFIDIEEFGEFSQWGSTELTLHSSQTRVTEEPQYPTATVVGFFTELI